MKHKELERNANMKAIHLADQLDEIFSYIINEYEEYIYTSEGEEVLKLINNLQYKISVLNNKRILQIRNKDL